MRRSRGQLNNGLTLIEVMVAMLIAMVIVIGAISYMYSCALNARQADVRATASRLGLLLLEGWKTQSGEINPYDPRVDFYESGNPAIPFDEFTLIGSPPLNPPGLANSFRYYRIGINGINYFVKMTYADSATGQRALNVAVAWDNNYGSNSLDDYDSLRMVSMTKFASYIIP